MKRFGNLIWAIALIVVGVILGSNALEITNINIFFNGWWTLFIIIPSLVGIFKENNKTGSAIGLLVGIILLLASNNILAWNIIGKLTVPAIIVIIGICILFETTLKGKTIDKIHELNKSQLGEYCTVFGSDKVRIDGNEFKGTTITTIFGGFEIDLRESKITEDIVINATAIFGGIDIKVPENVKVEVKSTGIFGGTDDKSRRTKDEKTLTVYINSLALFGGVEIK